MATTSRRISLHRGATTTIAVLALLTAALPARAGDCNRNGIPDNCDVDCRQPGCTAYFCGRSDDLSPQNGIPDECEGAPVPRTYTTTADFTGVGTMTINLDESVEGVLSRSQMPEPLPNLWVAASNRGTIVRINTDDSTGKPVGAILGEYYTAPEGRGRNPSRTSVNLDGEVWVSNRDEDVLGGSITRIGVLIGGTALDPVACEPDNRATYAPPFTYNTCVDRNGDGMITTSNGLIPLPWPYEDTGSSFGSVDTAEDECIISYVQVSGAHARFIAVNKNNDVWVGGSKTNHTFDLVEGDTGAILKTFDVGTGGYGGLVDCNDVLWSVSQSGYTGLFRYDTTQEITATACCAPDILADSNGDFEINELDQLVEAVSPGFFVYVNDNDDNGNGTPDMNESPVGYERDLAEVQLFTGCSINDPLAWWALSWADPAPDPDPTKIWFFSDKSNGELPPTDPNYPANAVAGSPIVNYDPLLDNEDGKYPWPPPTSVWVEALAPSDDLDLTFTISAGANRGVQTQTVTFSRKPRFKVKLRVVMVTEPDADLDDPRPNTGGCKLTQFEVANLVVQLIGDANRITNGLTLDWDLTIHQLESACMITSVPAPNCGDLATSCPDSFGLIRLVTSEWFAKHVVNGPGNYGGAAALVGPHGDQSDPQCPPPPDGIYCDGYDFQPGFNNNCTVNIYFVGNVRVRNPDGSIEDDDITYAYVDPSVWPDLTWTQPYVAVNDTAWHDHTSSPTAVDKLSTRDVLLHEVACHLLPQAAFHSPYCNLGGGGCCANDLCMDGKDIDKCMDEHNKSWPSKVNVQRMLDSSRYLRRNGCRPD